MDYWNFVFHTINSKSKNIFIRTWNWTF